MGVPTSPPMIRFRALGWAHCATARPTYNIHKCIGGRDRRYDRRICDVILHHEPDVVFLKVSGRRRQPPECVTANLKNAGRAPLAFAIAFGSGTSAQRRRSVRKRDS